MKVHQEVSSSLSPSTPDQSQRKHLTPIGQKIEILHTLRGLSAFEREFISQLRSQAIVLACELVTLKAIWERHRGAIGEEE